MKLYNNTSTDANWNISSSSMSDCGSLSAGETTDLPEWDNSENILVTFFAAGNAPPDEPNPFTITIPQTRPGMAVTIGLFHE